jgi:hypothetical protein
MVSPSLFESSALPGESDKRAGSIGRSSPDFSETFNTLCLTRSSNSVRQTTSGWEDADDLDWCGVGLLQLDYLEFVISKRMVVEGRLVLERRPWRNI